MAGAYDVLIVGGGLAGMTAGMYAARYGLATGIIERMMGGAQIINAERIENFPGFPEGISGAELAPALMEQAMNAGVEFIMDEAAQVTRDGDYKQVSGDAGSYRARAVIIATGSRLRSAGIPGEEKFQGRGVSHCATCDGPLSMGQTVGVVGGGDSAADEALTLTEYAGRVLLFHRRNQLRAQQALQDRLSEHPKIEIVRDTVITEIIGDNAVTGVRTHNLATNRDGEVDLHSLFLYVGLEPNSELVRELIKPDNAGHIPVNLSMETGEPGLYAAGDVRQRSAAQLVASAGDGATAAIAAYNYLRGRP